MILSWMRAPKPEPRVFKTHRDYVGSLPVGVVSFGAASMVALNPIVHHCRIGKIRIKQAA